LICSQEGCGFILGKAVDLFLERLWTYFYLRPCFLFLIEAMFVLLLAAEFRLFKGYVVLFSQLSFWVGIFISTFIKRSPHGGSMFRERPI
jgi:hypothetical protein